MRFTLCWMNGKQIFAASERSARWRALLNSAGKARSLLSGPLRPSGVPHGLRRAKGRAGHCGPAHLKAGLCPETGVRVSAKKENCGTRSALRGGETSRPHAWRALSLIRSGGVCRARKAIQITGKQDEHLRLDARPSSPSAPSALSAWVPRPSCPAPRTAALGVAWGLSPTQSLEGSKCSLRHLQATPPPPPPGPHPSPPMWIWGAPRSSSLSSPHPGPSTPQP